MTALEGRKPGVVVSCESPGCEETAAPRNRPRPRPRPPPRVDEAAA